MAARSSLALLMATLVCAAPACDRAEAEPRAATPPPMQSAAPAPPPAPKPRLRADLNVLLITIDALRADMPWTGYPRPIAPNLTKLAERSIVYSRSYALSSYTSMSLAGLLSGRYPSELERDGRATSHFGDAVLMFPELLDGAKFRAIGVHGHVYFLGATGISQGFDDWRVVPRITTMPAKEGAVVDDQIADILISALGDHAQQHAGKRFFAWAHFMDPHASYARHEGFPRFSGSTDGGLGKVGQSLRNQYDAEVVFTDHHVGRVLDWLDKQPFADKTAIVVSADHGEAFGEHPSYFEHGFLLYEETTKVPLIVHVPGLPAARIDTPRSHVDLARTFLEIFGVAAPAEMRGESLVPELLGKRPPAREIVIDMPYTDQTPRRRALIAGRHKLIVTETAAQPELFDLEADPREQQDLAKREPALLARMLERWKAIDAAAPDYPAPRRSARQY
jgi:choline-sulfatase